MKPRPVRIALIGIGNCASALIQGLTLYRNAEGQGGLIIPQIGPYGAGDIEIVAAMDIDARKVGKPLAEAVFALPNCALELTRLPLPQTPVVQMGRILDGIAAHLADWPESERPVIASNGEISLQAMIDLLRDSAADVVVNYLPVGSAAATAFYAEAALGAGAAFVNCIPVFIASHPEWAQRFSARGLPLIGDDIKSQFGATAAHRALKELAALRGVEITRTYQLNAGGNTDFLNMKSMDRIATKRISKTAAVQAAGVPNADRDCHIGPSDHVPWLGDRKVAWIRLEGRLFGGAPFNAELRLEVEDSPNSAAAVVDAVRIAKLALDRGIGGPLVEPSAFYCKHPPRQMPEAAARAATLGMISDLYTDQMP